MIKKLVLLLSCIAIAAEALPIKERVKRLEETMNKIITNIQEEWEKIRKLDKELRELENQKKDKPLYLETDEQNYPG